MRHPRITRRGSPLQFLIGRGPCHRRKSPAGSSSGASRSPDTRKSERGETDPAPHDRHRSSPNAPERGLPRRPAIQSRCCCRSGVPGLRLPWQCVASVTAARVFPSGGVRQCTSPSVPRFTGGPNPRWRVGGTSTVHVPQVSIRNLRGVRCPGTRPPSRACRRWPPSRSPRWAEMLVPAMSVAAAVMASGAGSDRALPAGGVPPDPG